MIPPNVDPNKSIFLPGAVPSAKNSKMIGFYYCGVGKTSNWKFNKNGVNKDITPTLRSSDQTEAYIKHIAPYIIENKQRFKALIKDLPKPYIIQLHFVRKTKAKFDFQNPTQCIADCISGSYWKKHDKIPHVATQWIDDDDIDTALFIPPLAAPFYSVDKDNSGVWITVISPTSVSGTSIGYAMANVHPTQAEQLEKQAIAHATKPVGKWTPKHLDDSFLSFPSPEK